MKKRFAPMFTDTITNPIGPKRNFTLMENFIGLTNGELFTMNKLLPPKRNDLPKL